MPNRKGPPPASSSLYVAQNRRTQRQNGVAAAIRGRANEVDEGGDRYYSGLDAGYASDGTEGDADVDDEDATDADGVDEDEEADAEGRVSSIQRIYSGSMRVPALPRPPEKSYDLILPSDKSSNASSRTSTGSGSEDDENASDSASVSSVDSDKLDAERYAWQNMLSNVLEGDVLKSEKTRLSSSLLHQLDDSAGQRKYQASQIWWGVRAALRQRSVEAEQRFVTEARSRIPKIFEELLSFTIPHIEDKVAWHAEAAHQVQGFLGHFSWALSLYPTSRSLQLSQSVFQEPGLQDRIDALQAWSTITSRLHVHLGILQKWTGSDALEITKPGLEKIDEETDTPGVEEREAPLTNGALAHHKHTKPKILDTSSFVERMMKEESIETLFKKRTIVDIYPLVRAAKETFLVNRKEFSGLGLPPFSDDLYALVSFPMLLVQEALILRLETAARVNKDDPSIILIDQLTEDFRDGLKRATQIKREYLEILEADPENVWQVPAIDLDAFNKVLVDALKLFFRLLHWKLKSGSKAIYLKETEVVENEWDFLSKATEQIDGGDMHIAEHFSMLTHRLILRVVNYFNESLEVLQHRKMTVVETSRWFNQTLDNVRQRHRKLLRFGKALAQRFQNAAEYSLETSQTTINLNLFISALCETEHFLVYNGATEENGIYMIANSELHDRPDLVQRIVTRAFTRSAQSDFVPEEGEEYEDEFSAPRYVLIISPRDPFIWTGRVMNLALPETNLDLRAKRVRLVAEGPDNRLAFARKQFLTTFPIFEQMVASESQAHLARVNRDIKKIKLANFRLCESIITSSDRVREVVNPMEDNEALLAAYFAFAADIGLRSLRGFERKFRMRLITELQRFAIKWVFFICEDCNPTDSRTFKWVVAALEFVRVVTKSDHIFKLSPEDFAGLRSGVASCMTLLISHFDILGARSTQEAHREKEKLDVESKEMRELISRQLQQLKEGSGGAAETLLEDFTYFVLPKPGETIVSIRSRWIQALGALETELFDRWFSMGMAGRTLDQSRPEDPSLLDLASSAANISIKWQQGKFIGSGTYGTVYLAVNLDSGDLMAVKEIRFQDSASAPTLISQVREEMSVMSMLHHPNIVEYFGIEVHRDKVYIFEEYCQNGSLASLLEHGPMEDEAVLQLYTYQLVDGLIYLHTKGVVHRDIKPDNILIDGQGMMKLADFGSAKVLAKKSKTLAARTRGGPFAGTSEFASGVQNSLNGTPMYMSPEVIKGEHLENQGAADVWSLGCVVLECATGKRPWAGLDNEWAIMFHIGVAKEHPPLPDSSQLSPEGIQFIKSCLTIDASNRPTAEELLYQPWLENFAEEFYPDKAGTESSTSTLDLISQDSEADLRQKIEQHETAQDAYLLGIEEEDEEA